MPKGRQAETHAAMEPWRRTKRGLSDYVRSEGKAQAGPDGRITKAARLVVDFLENPPERPSATDLSLMREMALMTAPHADAGIDARKRHRRPRARNPASYLSVNRSALSNELSKLRKEGVIDYEGRTYRLLSRAGNFLSHCGQIG